MTEGNLFSRPEAAEGSPSTHGAASDSQRPAHRFPSLLAANLFLVVGIVLLIVSSRWETDTLARYGLGIAVEVTLALLALLFIRLEGLNIRETARLRRSELSLTLLAVASVPGLWIAGVGLNLLSALVFGYTTPVSPSMFPTNALEAVALAMTTMVAAPVCEEIMFRGYVQRSYERRGIWTGILVGGFIFALYHLRFQGVFALAPVALALGFVAWRTRSVLPGIWMHTVYNAIATLILISTSFLPMQVTGTVTGLVVCLNLILAPLSLVALWLLYKRTDPVTVPGSPAPSRSWARWAWTLPALALAAVYAYAAVSEVLVHRFPERVLNATFELEAPEVWSETTTWTYAIQNRLGSDLGAATCSRSPREALYVIACQADYEGFDIADEMPAFGEVLEDFDWNQLPFDIPGFNSVFRAEPQSWTLNANWSHPELTLTALDLTAESSSWETLGLAFPAGDTGDGVWVQRPDQAPQTLSLTGDPVLMPHEWAWRFAALPFELPYGGDVTVVEVDPEGRASVHPGFLKVAGGEPSATPAGSFVAWRVTLSWENAEGARQVQSAWYAAESPHTLVRYDDGIVSYLLESVESHP